MRIHLICAVVATGLALWLGVERAELALILLVVCLVIALELVNSALERTVDLAEPHENALAALAKRLAASAVLVAAVMAVAIGLIIFLPYIRALWIAR